MHHFVDTTQQQQRADASAYSGQTFPSSTVSYSKIQPAESVADTEDFIKAVQPKVTQAGQRAHQRQQPTKAVDGYSLHRSRMDARGMFCLESVPCCSGPFTEDGQCMSATLGGVCSCKLTLPLPLPRVVQC